MTLNTIRNAAAAALSAFLVLGLSAADAASYRLGDHPEGAFADAPDN